MDSKLQNEQAFKLKLEIPR